MLLEFVWDVADPRGRVEGSFGAQTDLVPEVFRLHNIGEDNSNPYLIISSASCSWPVLTNIQDIKRKRC